MLIFDEKPTHWGLRGDPFLWDEMKKHFSSLPKPESELLFTLMFYKAFHKLTGEPLQPGRTIFVDRYDQGGMSSGMIEIDYWLQVIYPLVLERFKELKTESSNNGNNNYKTR